MTSAIGALLEGVSRKDLARRAQTLSAAYRQGRTSSGIAGELDVAAYVAARMPATYAACAAVFARVAEAMPDFTPQSLLDVGAGPGTAAFAARQAWPSLSAVTLLEHNAAFRAVAATLLPSARIIADDLGADKPRSDLLVASYVLAELPEASAAATARHLWESAGQMLVLVEPGTPAGFARIRQARAALIEAGAHVAAPCTHDNLCPMTGNDWCHFSQRLPRSRDHMQAKGANVPFEDERYSYVVVTRDKIAKGARVLAPPLETKPGLTFKLCDETGLRAQFVATRDKEEYRRVRKHGWGDLF
ncbi:MAG TPA: small ribosomal subunit Rsm22 family protein [Rhizomicrobium sp.]|nr:small ribosomal subunit Rsm22 family protein [Rhizomicrobium sp.]